MDISKAMENIQGSLIFLSCMSSPGIMTEQKSQLSEMRDV